jgi:hypothetical protein
MPSAQASSSTVGRGFEEVWACVEQRTPVPRIRAVVHYLRLRRSMRVRARSFLYLCLRIFFRRFLTTLLISLLPLVQPQHVRHALATLPHLHGFASHPG